MKYRLLGRTELQVSEIGFGCWAIGGTSYGPTRDEESLAALETAWAEGVNFYDTADTYGHGHSEELVGRFLKDKPRAQAIIATKAGWDFYHDGGSKKNFDPAYLAFACEQSLKRLGLETIDLYQLHNPSLEVLQDGKVLEALEELRRQGKIRFIGLSVHTEEEALAAIRSGRVDTLQVLFNLLDQRMTAKVFGEAKQNGVGIIVREPLANGLLSGKYRPGHVFAKDDHRRRWPKEKFETDLRKIEMMRANLSNRRLSLIRAALEYVLEFDAVSTVIPGIKTREQLRENILASADPLLRAQETSHLRDLYHREDIFRQGLQPKF